MISIDRLAMQIAGKKNTQAQKTLERFGFNVIERSEIIAAHWRRQTDSVDPDWQAVAVTIKSTMKCSIRLGDRLNLNI